MVDDRLLEGDEGAAIKRRTQPDELPADFVAEGQGTLPSTTSAPTRQLSPLAQSGADSRPPRQLSPLAQSGVSSSNESTGVGDPSGYPMQDDLWFDESTNTYYMVYFVPNTQPPIPLLYEVDDMDMVYPYGPPNVGQRFSGTGLASSGGIMAGGVNQLSNIDEAHPFDVIADEWEKEARIRPWLLDPQVLAVYAEAFLEGRQPSDADLITTDWYQNHSAAEQDWLVFSNSDPAGAADAVADAINQTRLALEQAGVANASDELVEAIANNVITGAWTPAYGSTQIALLADPAATGDLDESLTQFTGLDTTRGGEDTVRKEVEKWLGPRFLDGFSPTWVADWAGRIRNDPDAITELTEHLRAQRLALYPGYEDPTLTYQDIAGPWRTEFFNVWGQQADEMDPLFGNVIAMNDQAETRKLLVSEGLKRGIGKVVNNTLGDLMRSSGGGVRQADRGIL